MGKNTKNAKDILEAINEEIFNRQLRLARFTGAINKAKANLENEKKLRTEEIDQSVGRQVKVKPKHTEFLKSGPSVLLPNKLGCTIEGCDCNKIEKPFMKRVMEALQKAKKTLGKTQQEQSSQEDDESAEQSTSTTEAAMVTTEKQPTSVEEQVDNENILDVVEETLEIGEQYDPADNLIIKPFEGPSRLFLDMPDLN